MLNSYFSEISSENFDGAAFITKNEAKRERRRIERLFVSETDVQKEARIKKEIITEIKRKYTIQFREAVRFILELIILQLLLFSCAQRSNIISIIYLGLLLMYIKVENKEKSILNISRAIGISLLIEYSLVLVNITAMNSPMTFPSPYEFYPCST